MAKRNRGIRGWPFVSLNVEPEHLKEWTRLARVLGRSRADLMREALEYVGLPYAQGVARKQHLDDSTPQKTA